MNAICEGGLEMAASSNVACRSSHGRSARSRRDDELHLKEMHPMDAYLVALAQAMFYAL
jgi:hypothetical protein